MESGTRQLSDRERTVLLLAADGLTDKEIAKYLDLSQRTIGTYWERMRDKIGHHSRTQLVTSFVRGNSAHAGVLRYKSLFSAWDEGVWIIMRDGTTVYANRLIPDLFEMSLEEFQVQNARELLGRVALTPVDALFDIRRKAEQHLELQLERSDGETLWLSMTANALSKRSATSGAVVLRVADVSVQRRVQHTLDSCESSVQFLTDHSSDFICYFDTSFVCTKTNDALRKGIGEDINGKNLMELPEIFSPCTVWADHIKAALDSGRPQSFASKSFRSKEPVTTNLLPLPTESNKSHSVLAITQTSR